MKKKTKEIKVKAYAVSYGSYFISAHNTRKEAERVVINPFYEIVPCTITYTITLPSKPKQ